MKKNFVSYVVLFTLFMLSGSINPTFTAESNTLDELVEIDFEDISEGDIVTNQYASQGVNFALLNTPDGYIDGPKVRDVGTTHYPPNGTGFAIYAGDGAEPFYDIKLSFSDPINYFSIYALDADEPMSVHGYFKGSRVASVSYPAGSDKQVLHVELGNLDGSQFFDKIVLDVTHGPGLSGYAGGPEYFDNLSFNKYVVVSTTQQTPTLDEWGMILLVMTILAGFYKRKQIISLA